eukprot:m.65157 g.65157  ORF g.65157 m.65157 type:complete len:105 (+) comp11517_c1_seq1:1094-1408(+)
MTIITAKTLLRRHHHHPAVIIKRTPHNIHDVLFLLLATETPFLLATETPFLLARAVTPNVKMTAATDHPTNGPVHPTNYVNLFFNQTSIIKASTNPSSIWQAPT